METYNTQLPARKLKDSCDVCSASKLPCDKLKPTCTGCASLNRPCTYSPARRTGRPHRIRRATSQSQSQSQDQNQNRSQSQSQNPPQCFRAPHANTTNGHLVKPTGIITGQTNSELSCDKGWFPKSTQTISHHHLDGQPPSAEISQSSCTNIMSAGLDSLDTEETDCTKVALAVVEQLEKMSEGRQSAALSYGGGSLTATEACQRLLTILMCPCSEQTDVALLVASGCISLMDVVHRSAGGTGANPGRGSASLNVSSSSDGTSISSHGSCEPDLLLWSRQQSLSSRSWPGTARVRWGICPRLPR